MFPANNKEADSRAMPPAARYKEWSGIASVLPSLKQAVGILPRENGKVKVNGWVTMALVLGVDEVCDRMISRIDTFSIIAGLLIVSTMSLVATPSQQVTEYITDGSGFLSRDTFKILYMLLSLVSLVCLFITIIIGSMFTQTLRVTARNADRLRVLIKRDWLPSTCDIIFTIGNIALAALIGLSMLPVFGELFSGIFVVLSIFINGLCMHLFNLCFLLKLGHPVHGWKKEHPEEFDLRILVEIMENLAQMDRENNSRLTSRNNE